jgi:hypothetical protein
MSANPYVDHLVQKGYTERELRQPAPQQAAKVVPEWYLNRYPDATWDSYQEGLADFLNGN